MTTATRFGLSKIEVIQFRDQGYLPGPYDLCSPDEMAAIRDRVDVEVLGTDPPFAHAIPPDELRSLRVQYRNLDKKVVWDLCSHPAVTGAISSILGRDLILWRSLFFHKLPGGEGTKWHTDVKFWPMLDPQINVTAWIALTDTDIETACMQVIPGSHKVKAPHVGSSRRTRSPTSPMRTSTDGPRPGGGNTAESRVSSSCLMSGSCTVPTVTIRRIAAGLGLAVRVTTPYVRVDHDQLFPGHKADGPQRRRPRRHRRGGGSTCAVTSRGDPVISGGSRAGQGRFPPVRSDLEPRA